MSSKQVGEDKVNAEFQRKYDCECVGICVSKKVHFL